MPTTDNISQIKTVVFDLDRTVVDSKDMINRTLKRLFYEERGVRMTDEDLKHFHGLPAMDVLAQIDESRVDGLLEKALEIEDELRSSTQLFEGILDVLNCLSQSGYSLGVVTSQSRAEMESTFDHFHLEDYFQARVCSEDVEHPKPSPDPLLKVLHMLQGEPESSVMIGDSVHDMRCGRSAGAMIGAALWGAVHADEIKRLDPDFLFEKPSDIMIMCD